MKKLLTILLILGVPPIALNAQTSKREKWKDTISTDADFHNYIGYRIADDISKDSAYRYYNPRPINVFFDFNDSGRLLNFFCAGQIKQQHIDVYKAAVEAGLQRADSGFRHKYSKHTLMQVFLEQGDSTRHTPEVPDLEYGGYKTRKGVYVEKKPIPLFGFHLLHNQAVFNNVHNLSEKKPIVMLYPITITLRKKHHATIYLIKRKKSSS
jgi:hypothetical protein